MATSRIPYFPPAIRLSPVHSRTSSRSASPERNPGALYQKIDPLLSNLSPESTLNALTSMEAVPSNEKRAHDILSESISQVSPAERALGIRAAVAAQNLSLWFSEVRSWGWPSPNEATVGKGFVPPPSSEPRFDPGRAGSSSSFLVSSTENEYYGSLPADMVERYETRIEEIRDGMDDLNVEELKEHVLSAHIPARSRPSSNHSGVSIPPPLSYVQLSDFTAVITATILRALPFLSKLNSLLSTWDVRLLVLRQIPGLLRELHLTRTALHSSLKELRSSDLSDATQAPFSSSYLQSEHVKLESAVVAVGRRVDRILDALEGRQDSLPERWIDDLEGIESDFAAWVVEAERYKIRAKWLQNQSAVNEAPELSGPEPEEQENSVHEMEPIEEEPAEEESVGDAPNEKYFIEEEPQRDSEITPEDSAQQAIAQPEQDSLVSNSDGPNISTIENQSPLGSPPAAEIPGVTVGKGETPEKLPAVAVAEDLAIPTQMEFLPERTANAGEQQPQTPSTTQQLSPAQEYKENIPPPNSKQQEPAMPPFDQSFPGKPATLSEHKELAEDPFIQSQAPRCEGDPEKTSSVDKPDDGRTDLASSNEPKDAIEIDVQQETTTETQAPQTPLSSNCSLPKEAAPVMTPKSPGHSAIPDSQPRQLSDTLKVFGTPTLAEIYEPVSDPPARLPSQQTVPTNPDNCVSKLKSVKTRPSTEENPAARPNSRMPLQSPIKLSKARRPGKLDLDKNTPKPHRRRTSSGSVDSLLSDTSSLISSVHPPEPHTGWSNETPLLRQSTRPKRDYSGAMPSYNGHTLREDRLRRLDSPKGSSLRAAFQQNRIVSLPMERFINESMDISMGDVAGTALPDDSSSTPTPQVPRAAPRRPALTRGKSASELTTQLQRSRFVDQSKSNLFHHALDTQSHTKSHLALRKRLTAHRSLESLGIKRQELTFVEEDEAEFADVETRASTPIRQLRKPRDRLDQKVSSILNTLPGRIHLVDPNIELDTSSSSSSLDRRLRGRLRSESPTGLPSRSITPAPSLTLMPAGRRRQSVHKSEDSYVKLYHLHHGGQTVPTKLFVRTVGEDGQRLMVRVGGGWADLGEYLREYITHHGRRKVSETPRVEVQGLASRESPAYSPLPGTLLSSTAPTPSYLTLGRATPSRPPSVLSTRPPSSLTVHKTRRGSSASDAVAPRAVTTGNLNPFTTPQTTSSGRRRLSVSSNYSNDTYSPATTVAVSTSTPLGLAGPKPRSRQVSMSPQGEAWIQDVLQQTRRSGSTNPAPFPPTRSQDCAEPPESVDGSLPDLSVPRKGRRSVSDIGTTGSSRRVVLRGLGSRRS